MLKKKKQIYVVQGFLKKSVDFEKKHTFLEILSKIAPVPARPVK